MDQKNLDLISYGPEYALGKFVNLPATPDDPSPAEQFQQRWGDLYPGLVPADYWGYVQIFRQIWTAKTAKETEAARLHIARIFEREPGLPTTLDVDDPTLRPATVLDYQTGKVTIRPRTLLDWLAKALLEHKGKMAGHALAICARKDCPHRYFVKTHSRLRHCSEECSHVAELDRKNRWARKQPKNAKRKRG